MTKQMSKKLRQHIEAFEKAVRDHDNKGSQPIEYHDLIDSVYEKKKLDLINLVESFTK